MRIISFAYTTPALIVLLKLCTRRDWVDSYAARFHKGDLLQAWNWSPRVRMKCEKCGGNGEVRDRNINETFAGQWIPCPVCNGTGWLKGKKVATIELTEDPYKEWSGYAPGADYRNEGFEYLSFIGAKIDGLTPDALWTSWHALRQRNLWVIRFKVVEILDYSELKSDRWKRYQLQTGGNEPVILYPRPADFLPRPEDTVTA